MLSNLEDDQNDVMGTNSTMEMNVTEEINTTMEMNNTIETNATMDIAPVNITISAPPEVFNVSDDRVGYVLTFYSTPTLFQVKEPDGFNESVSGEFEFVADSAVVGLNISRDDKELSNLTVPVNITLQSLRALGGQVWLNSHTHAKPFNLQTTLQNWSNPICVSWDFGADNGMDVTMLSFLW